MAGCSRLQLQMVTAVHHYQQGPYSCQRTEMRCFANTKQSMILLVPCVHRDSSQGGSDQNVEGKSTKVDALTCKPPPKFGAESNFCQTRGGCQFQTDRKKGNEITAVVVAQRRPCALPFPPQICLAKEEERIMCGQSNRDWGEWSQM